MGNESANGRSDIAAASSVREMPSLLDDLRQRAIPDPLRFANGDPVTTAEVWGGKRRAEVLELFRTHVFGRTPIGRPETQQITVVDIMPDAMNGAATRKLVDIAYSGPGGSGSFRLIVFLPNAAGDRPVPATVFICNRPPDVHIDPSRERRSPFWPAEDIVARGYAAIAFHNGDVAPDKNDDCTSGVFRIFDNGAPRLRDSWATIAAWAWGASRAMDYCETDPRIDPKRIALVGHSRGGKTALWCGAQDERYAAIYSNAAGCTGDALARGVGPGGEKIADINRTFPYWFCDNYKTFNGSPGDLPVDFHELIALIAPRPVYVGSCTEDAWADPESQFLACVTAEPVYRLFGLSGVGEAVMPEAERPRHNGTIGYHLQTGKHDLNTYSWMTCLDFLDRHIPAGG